MEKRKYGAGRRVVLWVVFAVFVLYAFSLLYPFSWAFPNSLKSYLDYWENGSFSLPKKLFWVNYASAFEEIKIGGTNLIGMFINSVGLSLGGTLASVLVSAMTAYVIADYDFRGRKIVYTVAIFVMVIPVVGSLPAQYRLLSNLGLRNNLPGMIITYAGGFGFNFFMLYGYFKTVSWSYAEAAYIDGANDYQIFWKIMLRQAMPAMFAVGIIQFINIWNDYTTPFLYLDKVPTLSLGLFSFQEKMTYAGANYPVYFSALLMATLPVVILFAAFQKQIMENTVAGGLKG